MTSNVAPPLVNCNSPSMSIRSSPASTPVSVCTPVMGDSFKTQAEMSAVLLDTRRMAKLGEELVIVVAADDVMRHRNANRGRGLDRSACAGHQLQQACPHDGKDPAQLGDDDLRLDVDQSDARIRVLVLDDEPQRAVQLLRSTQTGRRPADAVVEHLALEDAERVEQFTLGGKPAV